MKRRLSDKVKDAVQLAVSQGREEFARRLDLIYQAIYAEEVELHTPRRRTDETTKDEEAKNEE